MSKGIRSALIAALTLEWMTIAITIVIYLASPATISLDVQTALLGLMTVVLTQVLVLLGVPRRPGPTDATLADRYLLAMQIGAQIARDDLRREAQDEGKQQGPATPPEDSGGRGLRAV